MGVELEYLYEPSRGEEGPDDDELLTPEEINEAVERFYKDLDRKRLTEEIKSIERWLALVDDMFQKDHTYSNQPFDEWLAASPYPPKVYWGKVERLEELKAMLNASKHDSVAVATDGPGAIKHVREAVNDILKSQGESDSDRRHRDAQQRARDEARSRYPRAS